MQYSKLLLAAVVAASVSATPGGSLELQARADSLTLDPSVIQSGSTVDGSTSVGAAEVGQAKSKTSNNNFMNNCLGKKLTNGLQILDGSCNGITMGDIPAKANMISAMITFPTTGGKDIQSNTDFNITVQMSNLNAGVFTNPDATYYAAPQFLDAKGFVVGHVHITVENMGKSLNPSTALDATQFAFFKGINDAGNGQGLLTAVVTGGLPAGNYRVCTLTSAANHQPVIMPVAQRGAQDDCTKFVVSGNGNTPNIASNNGSKGIAAAALAAEAVAAAGDPALLASASSAAVAAAAGSTDTAAATAAATTANNNNNKGNKGNKGGNANQAAASAAATDATAAASTATAAANNKGNKGNKGGNANQAAATAAATAATNAGTGGAKKNGGGNANNAAAATTAAPTATAAAGAGTGTGGRKNGGGRGAAGKNNAAVVADTNSTSIASATDVAAAASTGSASTATAASGTNVQTFTGALGGAAPAVIFTAGADRPFSVNGDTFVNSGAALQRSCSIQHNICADSANSGSISGGVAVCESQETACNAAISSTAKRFVDVNGHFPSGRRTRFARKRMIL